MRLKKVFLFFLVSLLSLSLSLTQVLSQDTDKSAESIPLGTYPLPPTLANCPDSSNDDYFSAIKTSSVGSLIWHRFPITVYIEKPETLDDSAESKTLANLALSS